MTSGIAFSLSRRFGLDYESRASLPVAAVGKDFELSLAVAFATFGITSSEALAAEAGPLSNVPAMVGRVVVSLWVRRRWSAAPSAGAALARVAR